MTGVPFVLIDYYANIPIMNILAKRIKETEQKFEQLKTERENYLVQRDEYQNKSDEVLTEMTKLQGAWAALQELQTGLESSSKTTGKANKATVLDAVPEEK